MDGFSLRWLSVDSLTDTDDLTVEGLGPRVSLVETRGSGCWCVCLWKEALAFGWVEGVR